MKGGGHMAGTRSGATPLRTHQRAKPGANLRGKEERARQTGRVAAWFSHHLILGFHVNLAAMR